jgi:hypothetical protein
MQEMAASTGSAQIQASADALKQFQQETASSQTDARVQIKLEAMQQLARYLQGIPGRKNVVWCPSRSVSSAISAWGERM